MSARSLARARLHDSAGLTLIEVMVSIAIMAMMSLLIYGAFQSLGTGRKAENLRVDRVRQGRQAVARIARELQSAYLSMHSPALPALQTRITAFIGQSTFTYDRLDFVSLAHRRVEKDKKESDQAEVGYFACPDPDVGEKMDLCRREQSPIDMYPKQGGVVNVLAEDIDLFDVRYYDPTNGRWLDTWDTTQASGQPNRLPFEVKITLTLKHLPPGMYPSFVTKVQIPMQNPLSFGILQ